MYRYLAGGTVIWTSYGECEDPRRQCEELVATTQYRASGRKQLAVISGFCCRDHANLREFATQQILQVSRASMVAIAHASKDDRMRELVTFLFCDMMVAILLVNCNPLFQLVLM